LRIKNAALRKRKTFSITAFSILHSEKLYPKAVKVYAMHGRGAILQKNRGPTLVKTQNLAATLNCAALLGDVTKVRLGRNRRASFLPRGNPGIRVLTVYCCKQAIVWIPAGRE
jgi:hypothetical protein